MTSDPLENYMVERNAKANGLLGETRLRRTDSIDLAVEAFRSLGWAYLKQTILPCLYCLTVFFFVVQFIFVDLFTTKVGTAIHAQYLEFAIRLGMLIVVGVPLLMLGVSYFSAIATVMVGDWVGGLVADSSASAKRALSFLPKVTVAVFREAFFAGLAFVVSAAVLLVSSYAGSKYGDGSEGLPSWVALVGFFGLTLGFLFLAFRWITSSLIVPVIVNENLKASKAAKRSRQLLAAVTLRGRSGNYSVLNLLVTMFFLEMAMGTGLGLAGEFLANSGFIVKDIGSSAFRQVFLGAFDLASNFVICWIAFSFGAVGRAAIYFERRVQVEGYDIELMARAAWRAEKRARFEL